MIVTPPVTLSREINPFRVSPFISHEIQVTVGCGSNSNQANHFMKRHTPVDNYILVKHAHRGIYGLIHQAEKYGFVSH